jgi:hypothetical protein
MSLEHRGCFVHTCCWNKQLKPCGLCKCIFQVSNRTWNYHIAGKHKFVSDTHFDNPKQFLTVGVFLHWQARGQLAAINVVSGWQADMVAYPL